MKKNLLTKLIVSLITVIGLASCSDDEPQRIALQLPTADFSYEMFDTKVVFTDKSQNAEAYYWTFGDGTTSTEQNPTHTYTTSAKFTAELTITGIHGKTDSKRVSIDLSDGTQPPTDEEVNITLDGKFDDWDAVPSTRLASATLAEYENSLVAIKEVKFCANEDFLFFYLKADRSMYEVLHLYIDKDNDDETGYTVPWDEFGADYLFEAGEWDDFDPALFAYSDDNSDGGKQWNWFEQYTSGNKIFNFSPTVENGDIVEFEVSISREYLPDLGRTIKIGIAVQKNWANIGLLPGKLENGDNGVALTLRVTK